MADDNPNGSGGDGGGSDKPAAEQSQIASAIQSFERRFQSARENPTGYERESHRWAIRTGKGVIVYTLVTVGIAAAAIWSSWNAQRAVDLTAKNFVIEQRPYLWLGDNLGSPAIWNDPDGKAQIYWSWFFTNYGKTPANDMSYRTFISLGGAAFKPSFKTKDDSSADLGAPVTPNKAGDHATVISEQIGPDAATTFLTTDHGVRIAGIITYKDAYGNIYETDFCLGKLKTGDIAYERPSNDCHNEIK